jgi:DNA-binding NtrC family response regulator
MNEQILVVDDDSAVAELWRDVLIADGYRVTVETDPQIALTRAREQSFDLLLTDVEMPNLRGTELLRRLHAERPGLLIVLITGFGTVDLAVEALRAGAADFVSKPTAPEALVHVVRRALRERALRREVVRLRARHVSAGPSSIVAESDAMRRALDLAARVARFDAPVYLSGESGTGKTMLARHIHESGGRSSASFVAVNASALPSPLAEAELFGVRRGAYTDAREDRAGLFRAADGGTLFLDEVVDLPAAVQAKLLQTLETFLIRRVGDTVDEKVDVRLIAASNRPLASAVDTGMFRADLRYRLEVLTIEVPPLRARPADLRPLVDQHLHRACERYGRGVLGVTDAGWRWLLAHPWPGNVRELINRVERAVVFADHDFLGPEDFADPAPPSATGPAGDLVSLAARGTTLEDVERLYVTMVLDQCAGNKAEAARRLGIDRKTLSRKVGDSE